MKSNHSHFLSPSVFRLAVSLVGIAGCLFGIWITFRAGFSSLLGKYAMLTGDLAAADRAVELTPSNAESHMIRAAVLYHLKQVPEAARELELTISLRPRDHILWVQLAIMRDDLRDSAGALTAFNEAVRWAPFYAYPSWQRGNLLLRMGRYEDAFADLRRAAASNPDFTPNLVDLAWTISKGDRKTTEQLAQITTNEMRIAFAKVLARHGKTWEAVEQFALAGTVPDQARRDLTRQLIATNAFKEAFEIWKSNANSSPGARSPGTIYDGGFEGVLTFDDFGFGWRVPSELQGVKLAADASQFQSGSKSLLIEFRGDSNPRTPLVSQLVLVEPSRRYRVTFGARTQDMVTGGLPTVAISEATGGKQLAESPPVRPDTPDWQTLSFDFQSESTTNAVVLTIQRNNCAQSPCPIFGSLWLDSFSIEELK